MRFRCASPPGANSVSSAVTPQQGQVSSSMASHQDGPRRPLGLADFDRRRNRARGCPPEGGRASASTRAPAHRSASLSAGSELSRSAAPRRVAPKRPEFAKTYLPIPYRFHTDSIRRNPHDFPPLSPLLRLRPNHPHPPGPNARSHQCATAAATLSSIIRPSRNRSSPNGASQLPRRALRQHLGRRPARAGDRLEPARPPAAIEEDPRHRRRPDDRRAVAGHIHDAAPLPQHLQPRQDRQRLDQRAAASPRCDGSCRAGYSC